MVAKNSAVKIAAYLEFLKKLKDLTYKGTPVKLKVRDLVEGTKIPYDVMEYLVSAKVVTCIGKEARAPGSYQWNINDTPLTEAFANNVMDKVKELIAKKARNRVSNKDKIKDAKSKSKLPTKPVYTGTLFGYAQLAFLSVTKLKKKGIAHLVNPDGHTFIFDNIDQIEWHVDGAQLTVKMVSEQLEGKYCNYCTVTYSNVNIALAERLGGYLIEVVAK